MSVSGYTIGQDVRLDIIVPLVGTLTLSEIVSFGATPTNTTKTVQPISGRPKHLVFDEGWTGTIEGERNDDSVDAFWARQEAAFFAGEDILGGTITQTITEKDGSISRYMYEDVQFRLEDAGTYKGNDTVMWRMSFQASRKLKLL